MNKTSYQCYVWILFICRLQPAVPGLPRLIDEDTEICGYHIPAKVGLFFPLAYHHGLNVTDTSDISYIHCMSRSKVC